MAKRIDEIANFKLPNEQLAAEPPDDTVAPDTRFIGSRGVTKIFPELLMPVLAGMKMDLNVFDSQVGKNRVPEVDGQLVVISTKREIA